MTYLLNFEKLGRNDNVEIEVEELNETIKKQLLNKAETIDIDVLAEWVKADGLGAYVDLADDEDLDGQMSLEAYNWLMNLVGE